MGKPQMKPMAAKKIICGVLACFVGLISFVSSIRIETSSEAIGVGEQRLKCFANTSFRFHFSNEKNNSIEIVECATPPSTYCKLLNETFTKKYSITSTSDGGVLTIMNCNKNDYGTYTCVNNLDLSEEKSIKVVCKDPSESEQIKFVSKDTSASNSNYTRKYLITISIILLFIIS